MSPKVWSLAGILMLSTAVAAPAVAQHGEPLNTTFSASGNTSLASFIGTIPCTSTFTLVTDGSTSSTNTKISQATFSGGALCGAVSTANLPWQVVYTSPTSAVIKNATFVVFGNPVCQGDINVTVKNSPAEVVLDNASIGSCQASGSLSVLPGSFHVVN